MAPIVAAVAQVSAAKTQAEADKFIAKTAADASITQTKIQASVTEQLSDNQRALSEKNLAVTQQLAREQEQARQERVNLQLSALQQERQAQEAERKVIRSIEQERIDQQIAFAKQQADENLKLARLSINSQLVTQGLAPVGGAAGARGRLSVNAAGSIGSSVAAVGSSVGVTGGARAADGSGTTTGNQTQSLNRGLSGLVSGLVGGGSTSTGAGPATGAPQPRAQASRALLASVGNPKLGISGAKGSGSATSNASARGSASLPRGLTSAGAFSMNNASAFSFSPSNGMSSSLARGVQTTTRGLMSTRENRNLILAERAVSDLNLVLQNVRSGGSLTGGTQDFSDYFADQEKKLDSIGASDKDEASSFSGAYRAPTSGPALVGRKPNDRAHSFGY